MVIVRVADLWQTSSMHVRASVVIALSLALAAPQVSAQVIRRERDKPSAVDSEKPDAGDAKATKGTAGVADDDILAPARPDGATLPDTEPPEPKAENATKLGVVALVPVGDASKVLADQVTAALLKELASSKAFDAIALAVDAGGSAQKASEDDAAARAALVDGDDKLKKARALLSKNQIGKARTGFEMALAAFEKAAAVLTDSSPLFYARVGLAEVAARQGNDDETATHLAAASVMMPELELDPKEYPPQFIRTHLKVRQKAMQQARGTIAVDATAAGSTIQLDGRETAGAPVRILEVPAGRHLVRALREGLPGWGVLVDVAPGAEVPVSPGFIAQDGTSYLDVLAQNKLNAAALAQIQKAAAQAGYKAALVGVVGRTGGAVPVQLVYVDAAGAGAAALPAVTFQGDLLDVSIESIKARERAEELAQMEKVPAGTFVKELPVVLEGAQAGSGVKIAEVKMRYDVKAAPAERATTRVVGADTKSDDGDGRSVLSGGNTGTRQRLDDEDDPYKEARADVIADPDAPITDQPWFWPVVIGGTVGVVVLGGGAVVLGLIGLKVIPDPRPADKGEVRVTLP